jgi:hypothetical protein
VKGYLEELEGGVSNTETFVAIKAEINNWRWAGRAVLSQHRQADERADFGDRGRVQTDPAFDLRRAPGGSPPTSW